MASARFARVESWTLLARLDAIALGQGRCFIAGGRRIAVFRTRADEVLALDALCPHRAGPLADGVIGDGAVVCPLHGYKFALADGRGLDSDYSVASYPAMIREGHVFISLSSGSAAEEAAPA